MSDSHPMPLDPEEVARVPSPLDFPVVGIGASVGGLGALMRFFERMPATNGMAFVVILHLSPTHESSAAEILQRATTMPVLQVAASMAIEADHVYVIPPNHDLTMNDGHLYLADPSRVSGKHVAIDLFFRSLGQVHQKRAIAVVLSGSGSDGAVGLARVKECGGVTLVQTPEDADHDSMPRAAIATGAVDFIMGVADMPQRLVGLWAKARQIRLPADAAKSMKVIAEDDASAFEALERTALPAATVHQSSERIEAALPSSAELHRRFVDEVTPPSVLVDARHEVLHLSENAGAFLLACGGEPSRNLLRNIPPELRTDLRTALLQVGQTGEPVVMRPVAVRRQGGQANIQLTLRYFGEPASADGLTLVMFEEVAEQAETAAPETSSPTQRRLVSQLINQIRHLKEQLHATVAQAETSAEDVKASNEELQAINEELRSASEELETSKEELQSINEELTTVNYELKVKVGETGKVNDDLQNLITSTDIATVFVDRSLCIKRFTPQSHSIFNLIASDINRSLLDITHRLDYEQLADDAAFMLKTSRLVERSVSGTDGRHYLARMCPYRSADNEIDGAVLTFVDVTALREAEEKVLAGEEALRVAARTTDDYAILTISEDGAITSWNKGATRMFGYAEEEIIGKPFAALFTAEDGAAGAEEELRLAREAGRSAAERWHRRKDGTVFYCGGVITRLKGKSAGYAMITRDMTDRKTLATTREQQLAHEQEANEVKDRFLAVLSHELKHPLNLIQVNAELLVSQPEVRALPLVARTGEAIRRAVTSQTKIIDDLLDLSRAQTGKMMLKPQTEDLSEIASSIVTAAREAANTKGVRLSYDCVGEAVLAVCDRVRTEQIIWNLINNAVKFTLAGGDVKVALSKETGFAKFTVVDTGIGISADFLPRIFGLFVQENDRFSRENTGLGVGLALVRDLAVAQGGRVLAESAGTDLGSRFSVWLPLVGQATGGAEKPAKQSVNLSGMRILAVDDMPELLESFALLLRIEGPTVDTAVGGYEGLRMLDAQHYDLLISDIGMDDMDGYELIQRIRKTPKLTGLRAIALSGYGRQVDVNRALRSGFDAHLAKPATVAHICQTIAQLAVKNTV